MEMKAGSPKLAVTALVRDKEGNVRFDDPSKIELFLQYLSEDDKEYLRNLYPEVECLRGIEHG